MTLTGSDLEQVLVGDPEHWQDGPPYELFKALRAECPVHWTVAHPRLPRGGRLLVGHDGRRRPHGQPRLADLLLRARRDHRADELDPSARALARDVHRDGPAQARPPEGALPGRLHAEADRRARGRDPRDRGGRARRARRSRDVRPRHRRRAAGRLARDRQLHGDPAGGRRDLGATDEHDARRGRPGRQPRGRRDRHGTRRAGDLRALPRADRRAPRAPDRRPDERARPRRGRRRAARGARDRHGLLPAASPPATTARRRPTRSGMRALLEDPASTGCCSTIRR